MCYVFFSLLKGVTLSTKRMDVKRLIRAYNVVKYVQRGVMLKEV